VPTRSVFGLRSPICGRPRYGVPVTTYQSAGFTDAAVEVTRTYTRQDLADLAAGIPAGELPADLDVDAVLDALDGAVAGAFVRATRP